jgi:NADPH:quinone reductase
MSYAGREMRSFIGDDGILTLSLKRVEIPAPRDSEVVVRVEAAPINPTDLGLMIGAADLSSLQEVGTADEPALAFTVPAPRLGGMRRRMGLSLPVGTEGAGTVIAAGRNAAGLKGKRVAVMGEGIYADYRLVDSRDVLPLPEGASAADGAAMFVNPLTALGFVETARSEGHKAIVHTAAASNLGQMLQRICLADDIPLINIVRSGEQANILRGIGASYVLNSNEEEFGARLADLIEQTGATIAFDAIGGGTLGSQIMQTMEQVALKGMKYNRYGSETFKQLYIYGGLDVTPTTLNRLTFGWEWSVSGWLLFSFLRKAGREVEDRLRQRVGDELTTTFTSNYTRTVGLAEALQGEVLHACQRKATGQKILIDPTRD